jgi:hypothetical protein
MTYMITKPCPVCRQQLTKQGLPILCPAHAENMFGMAKTECTRQ